MSVVNPATPAAGASLLLPYPDPLLHLGTRPLDLSERHRKAIGKLGGPWASNAQLEALTQLRSAVGYWLSSEDKAVVQEAELGKLSNLAGRMLSFSQAVVALPHFQSEWTSPLTVAGAPRGVLGSIMGAAASAAVVAAGAAIAAAGTAARGGTAADVWKSGLQGAGINFGSDAAAAAAAGGSDGGDPGLSQPALRTMWPAGTVQQEAAMWCFAYAAATRQAGLQRHAGMTRTGAEGPPLQSPTGNSVEGVTLLRQAAGLWSHLNTQVLPIVAAVTVTGGGKPLVPELQAQVVKALELTCLAEAQAMTAARAAEKGNKSGTLASLEAGCAQLFGQARAALAGGAAAGGSQGGSSGSPGGSAGLQSSRLAAYLAASQALHDSRARLHVAEDWEGKGELGYASAAGTGAEAAAREGVRAAGSHGGDPAWKAMLEQAQAAAAAFVARVEKDRLHITYQPLPKDPAPAPTPKVLVSVLAAAPPEYMPPLPVPGQDANQNCIVQ